MGLSACADDAPPSPDLDIVTVQPVPTEASGATGPDTLRTTEALLPADAATPTAPEVSPSAPPSAPAPPAQPRPAPAAATPRIQTVAVTVTATAFEPSRVALDPGVPARIVFTRTSDKTCATQVVFPSLGTGPVDLPLGEPVTVDVPASASGEIAFACGMDMLRGTLVVGS